MVQSLLFSHRRVLILTLIVFALTCLLSASDVVAEDSTTVQRISSLEQAAQESIQQKDYVGARDQYRQILRDYPESITAQCGLIKTLFCLNDFSTAKTETEKLLSVYSGNSGIVGAVREVADGYREAGHNAEAIQLYRTVVTNWPNSSSRDLLWSQRGLALCFIRQDDLANAKVAADALLSNYSAHPEIAKTIRIVADNYRAAGHDTEAFQLYQTAVTNWPNSNSRDLLWSHREMAFYLIRQDDLAGAKVAVDRLLLDHATHPEIARTIRFIVDGYRAGGYDAQASQLYQTAVTKWPNNRDLLWSQREMVFSLIRQGDLAGAKAAVDRLLLDHATHPEIARTIRFIVDGYRAGGYDAQASQLYQTAVTKWPSSRDLMWSQREQALSLIHQGDLSGATVAVDKLLLDHSTHPEIARTIRIVADNYRAAGHDVEASKLYQTAVTKWPNSNNKDLMWSQREQALSLIRQGDLSGAKVAVDKLLLDHSSHPEIARSIRFIVDGYRAGGYDAQASQLYQTAVTKWPSSRDLMWSQREQALSLIRQGDLAGAKVAVDRLLLDHATHPEIARTIRFIVDGYRAGGYDAEASQLYQTAVTKWPNSRDLMWSQREQALSLIRQGDLAGAKVAVDKLLLDHATHPEIARTIRFIVDGYRAGGYDAQASQLYQTAVTKWSNSRDLLWSQRELALSLIRQGDLAGAKAAVDKLLLDHATHPEIARTIRIIADKYHESQRDEEALELYQKVSELKPSLAEENNARAGIVKVHIQQGDETLVQPTIDFVLSNYNQVDDAANAIFEIGEEYYLKARSENEDTAKADGQNSIELIQEHVLTMAPSDHLKARAYYVLGLNYREIGDYAKAADALQKSYQADPTFQYADYCLFENIRCYGKLAQSGKVTSCEAFYSSYLFLNELTERFPDSKYCSYGQNWLSQCVEE